MSAGQEWRGKHAGLLNGEGKLLFTLKVPPSFTAMLIL